MARVRAAGPGGRWLGAVTANLSGIGKAALVAGVLAVGGGAATALGGASGGLLGGAVPPAAAATPTPAYALAGLPRHLVGPAGQPAAVGQAPTPKHTVAAASTPTQTVAAARTPASPSTKTQTAAAAQPAASPSTTTQPWRSTPRRRRSEALRPRERCAHANRLADGNRAERAADHRTPRRPGRAGRPRLQHRRRPARPGRAAAGPAGRAASAAVARPIWSPAASLGWRTEAEIPSMGELPRDRQPRPVRARDLAAATRAGAQAEARPGAHP